MAAIVGAALLIVAFGLFPRPIFNFLQDRPPDDDAAAETAAAIIQPPR